MTAPSNANTSGLETAGHIVWWKAGGVNYYPEGEAFTVSESCRVEPLVTAASAQARIAALERRLEGTANGWKMAAAAHDEQEARADRLAKALKETRNRVREWPIDDHETCMCGSPVASHGMGDGHSPVSQGDHAISMIVEAINEALAALKSTAAKEGGEV